MNGLAIIVDVRGDIGVPPWRATGAIVTPASGGDMRKLIVAVTAGAAVLAGGSLANRAEAMPAGAGLRLAIEDTNLTDKVHCRWGYPHHLRSWGWWDGCYRGYYPYYYYPGYPVGPSFSIVVGPRFHHHHHRHRHRR